MDLEGVDVDWIEGKLTNFVAETKYVVRPVTRYAGSGYSTTSNRGGPECGRPRAIELTEEVRPILDRLYPEWRTDNPMGSNDEFRQVRDASRRLLSRLKSYEEVSARLGAADQSPRIAAAAMHPLIWEAARAQWNLGQPHEAVLAAAKTINSMLQKRVSRTDVSERDLVQQAFTDKDPAPGKPRLRYPEIADDQTRSSMEQGVMNFGAGCFGAIRNPVGHRPNDEIELDEQTALEQLAALSLFARWIDRATLVEAETAP